MRFLMICLCFLYCFNATAQTADTTRRYAAKVYANGSWTPFMEPFFHTAYLGYKQRSEYVNFLSPSAALSFRNKRKNMHEIELSKLNIARTENSVERTDPGGNKYIQNGQQITTTTIAFRYEYIKIFGKNKYWRVKPSVGFAAMPYYHRLNSAPYISTDYPTSQTRVGIRHSIVPRITVPLSRRVFVDANIPIGVMDLGWTRQNILNPTLPARAQRYGVVDVDLGPRHVSARLGIGVTL